MTRLRKSSIFLIIAETVRPKAPAISSCFSCEREEKHSQRFPSITAYLSYHNKTITFIGV